MARPIRTIAIIGRGRAGQALRRSLLAIGCSVRLHRRATTTAIVADLVLLCVPEAVIPTIAVTTQALVCHVAGSMPMTAVPAARRGVFHPLSSLQPQGLVPAGTLFAIEADSDRDRRALFALARRLGGQPVRVLDNHRTRYHAGAVIAGNFATALLQLGIEQLVAAGIEEPKARRGLAQLLRSTADAAMRRPLPDALTGPVARASTTTLADHVEVLDDPESQRIYAALTTVLIDRVAKLTSIQRQQLKTTMERLDGVLKDR